jgi:uncharacterized membrane protein YfhO
MKQEFKRMNQTEKNETKSVKWARRLPLFAAFLIPLLISVIICIDHEVYPFGERCLLQVDMYHQYCPFFTEFVDKLRSGESLMYSWTIGLGADFVSLFAYYLASPLNWLILLCPKGYVIEFMSILMIVRISLCGLTFAYYLKKHFHTNHPAIAVFGTAYALSAFMAAYAWNVMWTDCLVLAPLIILGVEQLVKEKKVTLYYVTLAVSILSNYYISIMICIFLVLYFLILLLEQKEGKIGACLRFGWYSLLAGGTGAVLLIPEAIILGESGSQGISFPSAMEWYFNLIAELGRHCILVETYTGRDHWPNLYSGVFTLFLILLYVMNRGISWKKKVPRILLLVFMAVSFANNMLDFIWHGLHFPDSLPGRQSFLYSFLLLVLCFETFLHLRENRWYQVLVALVLDSVFLYAAYRLSDSEMIGSDSFFVTAVFIAVYAVLLLIWYAGKQKVREYIFLITSIVVIAELTVNFDMTGLDTVNRTSYVKDWKDYENVLNQAKEQESKNSAVYFYRTEEMERRTKNDAALSGYYSATQFSSLMNINVSHIYQDLGMEGGKNFYCINGASPLISSMLSLKYVIADNTLEEGPLRTLVASSGDTYLYENKYSLPLGFMVDERVAELWDYKNGGGVSNQNELAYLLGAEEEMLSAVPAESETGVSMISVPEDGYYFAAYSSVTSDTLEEEVSDGRTKSFTKASHGYILDLGYAKAGDVIKIKNSNEERVDITAYKLDMAALDTAYQTLDSQTMELTSFSDRRITGTIDVKKAGDLVFSIAKEDGWKAYVDGREINPEIFAEAFISIPLEEGTHDIELCYTTPGLKMGAGISLGCVLLFLVSLVVVKKFTAAGKNENDQIS